MKLISPPARRIEALDFLRGIAVLGILAVNIAGFAGPIATTDTPALGYSHLPPGHSADYTAFAVIFALFEGKMRALFSMMFGASMLLFIERVEARGQNGALLQIRRLGWLALLGYLHYLLFWWGDILFVYAIAGLLVLPLRNLPIASQMAILVAIVVLWNVSQTLAGLPLDNAEEHVRLGIASAAERYNVYGTLVATQAQISADVARDGAPFLSAIMAKLMDAPFWPFAMTAYTLGETVPLMLIGMILYRKGFFVQQWSRRALVSLAIGGLVLGGGWTAALLVWLWPRHFPPLSMPDVLSYWATPEHMALGLAYAALAILAAPVVVSHALGRRLVAVGRMAFSNYIGTTIVMTFVFHGWGLGLEGHLPRLANIVMVIAGWSLMLGWSEPWLKHFRQGPLEWLWRSLTEWRMLPMRQQRQR